MSAREIMDELPRLTVAELKAVERRIGELSFRTTEKAGLPFTGGTLRVERIAGRLVFSGARVVRQAEVEAILDEFP